MAKNLYSNRRKDTQNQAAEVEGNWRKLTRNLHQLQVLKQDAPEYHLRLRQRRIPICRNAQ